MARKAKKTKATSKKSSAGRAKAKTATKKATKKAAAPKAVRKVTATEAPIKKVRVATKPKNRKTLSYTQSEFIENIRGFCGLTKRAQAREIAEDLSALVVDALKRGYKIPLLGLGKMYVRQTKARMGRNPATGEVIQISAKKRVRFSPAKALKDAVL